MFTIEGSIEVREDPNKHLGLYGVSYQPKGNSERKYLSPGRRTPVKLFASAIRLMTDKPDSVAIEEITSLDQAARYAHNETRAFKFKSKREVQLSPVVDTQIEQGEQLLSGHAELWEEDVLYHMVSRGRLLDAISFDPRSGWNSHDITDVAKGRITYGLPVALGSYALEFDDFVSA